MSGTTAQPFTLVPSDATMTSNSIIQVMDAANPGNAPTGYSSGTDYTFSYTNHTITRVGGGTIPDGSVVLVTYTYTPADYFLPIRLDSMSDIQDRFGNAWDDQGQTIDSPLSHAASVAFENGATSVVLQPLFYNNAGTKQQPNNTQAASATTWQGNFTSLADIEDINVIVPVVGQSQTNVDDADMLAIFQNLQSFIWTQHNENQEMIGILGEDSSTANTFAQEATLQAHGQTLASRFGGDVTENLVLVNTSKFIRPAPGSFGGTLYVGGQYAAAGIAGMIAARPVSETLTRQIISGITGVADPRTKLQKNADAAVGLLVVEQKGVLVRIRHSITLDTTSTVRRELSIVRSKHRVIESLKATLDSEIIGQIIADGNATGVVTDAVTRVLEALKGTQDLVEYSNVQSRVSSIDPTMIEVRFSYLPAFPVNYINVVFSLDLTSQELTLASANINTG